jgi:serine/threonine protein kinase
MNEKYSSKCDVWSGGVLLFFIYFGYHPFIDTIPHNTLLKIKLMTEEKTIQLPEDCDPTIAKIIQLTIIYEDQERASWR